MYEQDLRQDTHVRAVPWRAKKTTFAPARMGNLGHVAKIFQPFGKQQTGPA